ncbi:MAG: hypothetical protein RLZZ630_1906 [Bacteroidota bacterium]|jgi:drug/metabolite transporter (DMT)-like permease
MTGSNLFLLFLAALFSSSLYIILKYFEKWRVDNLHGLTVNYLTACLLSFFVDHNYNISILHTLPGLLPSGLFIGMLFIVVFQIAALTAQKAGVAITSIAGKMSMVIPIIAGILLYGDKITTQRVLGMALAIVALVLSSFKSNKADSQKANHGNLTWLLPLLLFIGSGMVDTSIKWSQHHHMNGQNNGFYFSLLFGSAGIIGFGWSTWRRITQAKRIDRQSILAGLLLGTLNYFSLLFLVMVLESPGIESSLAFALSNVMVVLISTTFAILLFKEKLTRVNIAGLILAVSSILILTR